MEEAVFDMALGGWLEVGQELPEWRTGSRQSYRLEDVELVLGNRARALVAGAQGMSKGEGTHG